MNNTLQNIRNGIMKRASSAGWDVGGAAATGMVGNALGSVVGVPAGNIINDVATFAGSFGGRKGRDINKGNGAWALVPGVGAYRMQERQRAVGDSASGDKSLGNWRTYGPMISAALLAGMGAVAGHYATVDGELPGAAVGLGVHTAADIVGAITAAATKSRTVGEQREIEKRPGYILRTMIPGLSRYEYFKSLGVSNRL